MICQGCQLGFQRQQWHPLPASLRFSSDFWCKCYGSVSKESTFNAEDTGDVGSIHGSGRLTWRRKWQSTPVFWPGVSHGQRSLVGYSPQGPKSWPRLSTHACHPLPFVTIPFRSQDWCHLSGFLLRRIWGNLPLLFAGNQGLWTLWKFSSKLQQNPEQCCVDSSLGSICCCSVAQLCLTLCDPMDCSTPGFPVLHHLPELAQTYVHWVGDALQPSHPLSAPSPAFSIAQHQGLF